jgi:carboxyl-terminal processing protease
LRKTLGDGKGCPFDAVILDLRNNAGGLLDSAVEACDLFLEQGRIVSTRGRDGKDRSVFDAAPTTVIPLNVPLVVLINKYSASASEIVAACLQDHGRAIVIGERSWGKGTVQNLFPLEAGHSALKLTTATYWRPSGKNIHRRTDAPESEEWGVSPDEGFVLKLTDEQMGQVFRSRRDRDVGRSPGSSPPLASERPASPEKPDRPAQDPPAVPPVPTSDSSKPGSSAATFDDPQLRMAIEYLQQQVSDVKQAASDLAPRNAAESR